MSDEQCSCFLASTEHRGDWARVRCCVVVKSIKDAKGQEYLWVKIDPPVIGQPFGLGNDDIHDLLLTPRYENSPLHPIPQSPVPVYVFRLIKTAVTDEVLNPEDMILAAWGEIYATKAEADVASHEE